MVTTYDFSIRFLMKAFYPGNWGSECPDCCKGSVQVWLGLRASDVGLSRVLSPGLKGENFRVSRVCGLKGFKCSKRSDALGLQGPKSCAGFSASRTLGRFILSFSGLEGWTASALDRLLPAVAWIWAHGS